MIQNPKVKITDIWAKSANSADLIEPISKFYEGWYYEDKPSYQEWNWYVNLNTQFANHIQENGIPIYDSETEYQGSSFVKSNSEYDDPLIFQSLSKNLESPSIESRKWTSIDLLKYIEDVNVDLVKNNEVLYYYKNVWMNAKITSYPLIKLFNKFQDLEISEEIKINIKNKNEKYIILKEKNKFKLISISNFISENYNTAEKRLNLIKNKSIKDSSNLDVLIYDFNEKTWKNNKIVNLISEENIKFKKNSIECTTASKDNFGGVKIWIENNNLYFET